MKKTLTLMLAFSAAMLVSASAGDAKEIFEKNCSKCHGPDGKGQTKMGQKVGIKDYTDGKIQSGFTDEEAFKALKEGLKDKEGKVLMKPAENVTEADIKALIAQMRSFKK
jgi:cytochrome c551/c552